MPHTPSSYALPDWAIASPKRREHITRVTTLLDQWAGAMQIAPTERQAWHDAGLLHDVLRDAAEPMLRELTGDQVAPVRDSAWAGGGRATGGTR